MEKAPKILGWAYEYGELTVRAEDRTRVFVHVPADKAEAFGNAQRNRGRAWAIVRKFREKGE
jgi:hypothetical protein